MQANELRVGNWVDCRKGITQVVGVQVDCIETMALSDTLEHFDPIPLTPEILEECGFEQRNSPIQRFNDWMASSPFDKKGMRYSFGHFTLEWVDNKAIFEPNLMGLPVEHLHQLQNIIHSLKNTELQWNRKQ